MDRRPNGLQRRSGDSSSSSRLLSRLREALSVSVPAPLSTAAAGIAAVGTVIFAEVEEEIDVAQSPNHLEANIFISRSAPYHIRLLHLGFAMLSGTACIY